jgi:hypothetical protein
VNGYPRQITEPGLSRNFGDESKQGLAFVPLYGYMTARRVIPNVLGDSRFVTAGLRQHSSKVNIHPVDGGTPGRETGADVKTLSCTAPATVDELLGHPGAASAAAHEIVGPEELQPGEISFWATRVRGIVKTLGCPVTVSEGLLPRILPLQSR